MHSRTQWGCISSARPHSSCNFIVVTTCILLDSQFTLWDEGQIMGFTLSDESLTPSLPPFCVCVCVCVNVGISYILLPTGVVTDLCVCTCMQYSARICVNRFHHISFCKCEFSYHCQHQGRAYCCSTLWV